MDSVSIHLLSWLRGFRSRCPLLCLSASWFSPLPFHDALCPSSSLHFTAYYLVPTMVFRLCEGQVSSLPLVNGEGTGESVGPNNQTLLFFQLPYLIDGTHKLTQSNAILRYIGRKHNMCEWVWGWGRGAGRHALGWPGGDTEVESLLCGHRWGDRGGDDSCGHFGEPSYGCPFCHGQDLLQP